MPLYWNYYCRMMGAAEADEDFWLLAFSRHSRVKGKVVVQIVLLHCESEEARGLEVFQGPLKLPGAGRAFTATELTSLGKALEVLLPHSQKAWSRFSKTFGNFLAAGLVQTRVTEQAIARMAHQQ